MRTLVTLLALCLSLAAQAASDYAREQKWADEVLPSVLVGDPVYLQQANGHKFLGLYTPVKGAKAGVVVVHGIGVHPDWGLISLLRQGLAEAGYATLSIQMPILAADAKAEQYPPTFDEAAERLKLAVAALKSKGYAKVAIVSHSLGCRMTYHYLAKDGAAPVGAWAMLSTPAPDDLSALKLPILDLYGENDLPQVVGNAAQRGKGLVQKGSVQQRMPGADHFFEGKDAAFLKAVRDYLEQTL
jgi:predicted alpha/beta-hydrolase family hydrolase